MTIHEVPICSELVCEYRYINAHSFTGRFNRYPVLAQEHCVMSKVFFSLPVSFFSTADVDFVPIF